MALETLKGVAEIGGFGVVDMDALREESPERFNESGAMDYAWFEKEIRPKFFIYIRHDVNSISFTLQNGPIKENGVNGCQIDTMILAAKLIIEGFNKKLPCEENTNAITSLNDALLWLEARTRKRTEAGIEVTNQ